MRDKEILQFLRTWGKVVGKRNSVAGEGFQIYTDGGTDKVRQIRSDGADILEPFIRQHPAYQSIYPDSLNTVRPRSQDMLPVLEETTGLYGIKREALRKYHCRIGRKPYIHIVSKFEAVDINTEEDWKVAEYVGKAVFGL